MVRTAIKNGAVFEISYAGALGGDNDPSVGTAGGSEGGSGAKRNWWAAAREIVRVSKGKGVIVTGGVTNVADLRAPRDVGNLSVICVHPLASLTAFLESQCWTWPKISHMTRQQKLHNR